MVWKQQKSHRHGRRKSLALTLSCLLGLAIGIIVTRVCDCASIPFIEYECMKNQLNQLRLQGAWLLLVAIVAVLTGNMVRVDSAYHQELKQRLAVNSDGQLQLVPAFGDQATVREESIPAEFTPFFFLPVPVNTASLDLLTTLPGIGVKNGQRIIEYREAEGQFATAEELTKVYGIGPAKLNKLLPHIVVRIDEG